MDIKGKIMNIEIEFPFIMCSSDYHTFVSIQNLLKLLTNENIKYKERPQNPYQAVFYVDKIPKLNKDFWHNTRKIIYG